MYIAFALYEKIMGFFTPNYSKPGPGIEKDAPEKNRFFLFFELLFSKLTNLITINFVYALTMIPLMLGIALSIDFSGFPFKFTGDVIGLACLILSLFTSFPATVGFTFVLRNMQRREHAWLIRDMFKHAKLNYKKAVIHGIVQIVAYFLLYTAFVTYLYNFEGQFGLLLAMIIMLITLIFIWMQFYINTMIVTFDLTLYQIYKNALLFAIAKLPMNIFITVVCSALIYGLLLYPVIGFLLTFIIAFSLLGFITVFCIYPSIDKNMIAKQAEKENGEEA